VIFLDPTIGAQPSEERTSHLQMMRLIALNIQERGWRLWTWRKMSLE